MKDKLLLRFLDIISPQELFKSNFTVNEINELTNFKIKLRESYKKELDVDECYQNEEV